MTANRIDKYLAEGFREMDQPCPDLSFNPDARSINRKRGPA